MNTRARLIAFHGCDHDFAQKLISGSAQMQPSLNPYDWLGNGIYGWEESPERGMAWAREGHKQGRIKKPAVVGMVIDPGYCLDLVEQESLNLVRLAYENYHQTCLDSGIKEERNRGHGFRARYLDCAVIETLHSFRSAKKLQPFDTVRGFFVEGSELYPGAGLRDRDHIQICVRNPRCIKGYFIPR